MLNASPSRVKRARSASGRTATRLRVDLAPSLPLCDPTSSNALSGIEIDHGRIHSRSSRPFVKHAFSIMDLSGRSSIKN